MVTHSHSCLFSAVLKYFTTLNRTSHHLSWSSSPKCIIKGWVFFPYLITARCFLALLYRNLQISPSWSLRIWRPFQSLESLIQRTKTRVNVTLTSDLLSSFCLPLSSTSFSLEILLPEFSLPSILFSLLLEYSCFLPYHSFSSYPCTDGQGYLAASPQWSKL